MNPDLSSEKWERSMATHDQATAESRHEGHGATPDADVEHGTHDRGHPPRHDEHSHAGHDKHAGHDPAMFRRLFCWNLLLAIPVIVFSHMVQEWFGYSIDASWAAWVSPVIGTVIFLWGGQPFLKGAVHEVQARQPGMMLLIALAITVAYGSSLASSPRLG